MSSSLHTPLTVPINKRQDTIVSSRLEYSTLSSSLATGWDKSFVTNSNNGERNKISKKMKFPRRNSLTFPLMPSNPMPKAVPVYDNDPYTDLVNKRSGEKPACPLTGDINKALNILNDGNNSLDNTSNTSAMSSTNHSTETVEEDQVLEIDEFTKEANAISTPVPERKKTLQIPAAKRKILPRLGGTEESPTSVADRLNIPSLSKDDEKKKKKKSKSKKHIGTSKSQLPDPPTSLSLTVREASPIRKTKKGSRKQRKKVHFKQTCTMRRTLSRKDMTPKELRRTWLQAEEYTRMHLRDEILADRIDAGKYKPGTCIRGLESKIEESAMKKLHLRMTGIEEVLVEQERQWDDAGDSVYFYYDWPSFAYVYGPVSEEALKSAQEVAERDRKEAEKILTSTSSFKTKGAAGFLKRSRFTRRRSWA